MIAESVPCINQIEGFEPYGAGNLRELGGIDLFADQEVGKPCHTVGTPEFPSECQLSVSLERLKEALFYDPLVGDFTWRKHPHRVLQNGTIAGTVHMSTGYVMVSLDAKTYAAHRLAWFYMTGRWPADMLDHIDSNRLNNRFANLREANNQLNQQNLHAANSRNLWGYLGVHFHKKSGRFEANIVVNKRKKHLGLFDTPDEAHQEYLKAKRQLHEGNQL